MHPSGCEAERAKMQCAPNHVQAPLLHPSTPREPCPRAPATRFHPPRTLHPGPRYAPLPRATPAPGPPVQASGISEGSIRAPVR